MDVQTLIIILKTSSAKSLLKQLHPHLEWSLFFKIIGSDAALALAAKEATFAYHTATHWQSFRSSNFTSKLVSKLFEPQFSLGKTKCDAIVVNVIVPMCTDELHQELDRIITCLCDN